MADEEEGGSKGWLVILGAALATLGIVVFARMQSGGAPDAGQVAAIDAARAEPDAGPPFDAGAAEEAPPSRDAGPKRGVPGKPITANQLRSVVKKHAREIATCYKKPSGKLLARKIDLAIVVEPNGMVSSASIGARIPGAEAAVSCLIVQVRSWRFPAPGGTASQEISLPVLGVPAR